MEIEQMVIDERNQAGYESVPLGIWHWYKWEEQRVSTGNSQASEGVETHRDLCCYDFHIA